MYALVRAIARALVASWYRIRLSGPPLPRKGPVLLVSNHSGGLVDGALTFFLTERRLDLIAKFTLFKMPLIGFLVRHAGAIPIYRKKDQVDTSQNLASFAAIDKKLLAGGGIVIFPEGEGGSTPYLRPFKSGTARMVLSALERSAWRAEVRVVPVGIHYENRDGYRTTIHALRGEPLAFGDLRPLAEQDPLLAVEAVTERIRAALSALVPEHQDQSELPGTRLAADLIENPSRPLPERMVSVLHGIRALAKSAPARAQRLRRDLDDIARILAEKGLLLPHLRHLPSGGEALLARLRALLAGLLRLAGHITWLPAWLVARPVALRFAPRDKVVTFTLIGMMVMGLLWLSVAMTFTWIHFGAERALGLGALLILSPFILAWARQTWDESQALLRARRFGPSLLEQHGSRLARIQAELLRRARAFSRLEASRAQAR